MNIFDLIIIGYVRTVSFNDTGIVIVLSGEVFSLESCHAV